MLEFKNSFRNDTFQSKMAFVFRIVIQYSEHLIIDQTVADNCLNRRIYFAYKKSTRLQRILINVFGSSYEKKNMREIRRSTVVHTTFCVLYCCCAHVTVQFIITISCVLLSFLHSSHI